MTEFETSQTIEEYKAKCAYLEEQVKHLKKKVYTLKVNGFDNKDKIVQGLVNSGYVVGVELNKDYLGRLEGWEINIYE